MYKQLFLLFQYNIQKYLKEVRYVSLYNRQFENIQEEREFDYPAVLIEILPINYDNILGFNQTSIVNVRLHVGTTIYEGLELGDSQQNDALNHLNILDKLHLYLNNVATDDYYLPSGTTTSGITYDYQDFYIQSCRRKASNTTYSQSSLRVSTIDFELFVLDKTAATIFTELTGVTYEYILTGTTTRTIKTI